MPRENEPLIFDVVTIATIARTRSVGRRVEKSTAEEEEEEDKEGGARYDHLVGS